MERVQTRRRFARVAYSWPVVGLLAVLVLVLARPTFLAWQRSRFAGANEAAAARQLAELEERKAHLEAEIAALQTEGGVEAAIRQKFSVVKEGGERVISIIPSRATTSPPVRPSWWSALKSWFKKFI